MAAGGGSTAACCDVGTDVWPLGPCTTLWALDSCTTGGGPTDTCRDCDGGCSKDCLINSLWINNNEEKTL